MTEVLIIGGGFAGLAALDRLSRWGGASLILADRKKSFHFLPAVPDIIGRGISPGLLTADLAAVCESRGCRFLNEEVREIYPDRGYAVVPSGRIRFDYTIVAAGAQTEFYGNGDARKYGAKLYDVEDAAALLDRLKRHRGGACVVAGGGYTGVEAATALRRYFAGRKTEQRIILAEASSLLLGKLPSWIREYAAANLEELGIEIKTGTRVTEAGEGYQALSDGSILSGAMLVWTAGVSVTDFVRGLDADKDRQGRIVVDDYLRFSGRAFAAGDAARFSHKGAPLRMAVQFSIAQGGLAAENIIRSGKGAPLRPYVPLDAGYIIPMANNRSCGMLLSRVRVKGFLPTFLHYCMCVFRLPGMWRKLGFARQMLFNGKNHA